MFSIQNIPIQNISSVQRQKQRRDKISRAADAVEEKRISHEMEVRKYDTPSSSNHFHATKKVGCSGQKRCFTEKEEQKNCGGNVLLSQPWHKTNNCPYERSHF